MAYAVSLVNPHIEIRPIDPRIGRESPHTAGSLIDRGEQRVESGVLRFHLVDQSQITAPFRHDEAKAGP